MKKSENGSFSGWVNTNPDKERRKRRFDKVKKKLIRKRKYDKTTRYNEVDSY